MSVWPFSDVRFRGNTSEDSRQSLPIESAQCWQFSINFDLGHSVSCTTDVDRPVSRRIPVSMIDLVSNV